MVDIVEEATDEEVDVIDDVEFIDDSIIEFDCPGDEKKNLFDATADEKSAAAVSVVVVVVVVDSSESTS